MISESLLNKAVERGVLSLADLHALGLTDAPQLSEPEDDEKLRFVSGFSDLFVTLGIGLFVGAAYYLAGRFLGNVASWAVMAVAGWSLAEFFTLRRRMALPGIVLLCLFVVGVFFVAHALMASIPGDRMMVYMSVQDAMIKKRPDAIVGAALITMVMAGLHDWRFRLPITVAAVAGSLAGAALCLLFIVAPDFAEAYLRFAVLAAGLAIFAVAMRFHLSDPAGGATSLFGFTFWPHR